MPETQDKFKIILREHGLKVTNQRIAILQVLNTRPNEHLTVDEIYDYVKQDYPDIGLATVYRTILLLTDLNLVEKLNLEDGYVRYEIGDKDRDKVHRHHHLICLECGSISSFQDDLLENLENKIFSSIGFKVEDHEVKLFGHCKKCRNNTD